uniref:exodeoxyribonuclease III n=1 Tax=Monodelphis domestica TaxID=13616 RepID=F6PJD0_MONDO
GLIWMSPRPPSSEDWPKEPECLARRKWSLAAFPAMAELPTCETFVFLDLEATGLPNAHPEIAEISLFAIHRFSLEHPERDESGTLQLPRVLDKLTLCMCPEQNFTPKASEITGLSNQNLADNHKAGFDGAVIRALWEFLKRQKSPICLVAHNGFDYDFPLLRTELQRLGADLPGGTVCLDTLPALRGLDKAHHHSTRASHGKKSYSLGNLYRRYFDDEPQAAHSAEGDVYALVMVFLHRAQELLQCVQTEAQNWDEIQPMYTPRKRRLSGGGLDA